MDTNLKLSTSFDELVFEQRNKAYGAYQIRKSYGGNLMKAVLIATSIFGAALGAYFINMPEANAIVALKDHDHKMDTTILVIGPDQKKKEAKPIVKPQPPKGPESNLSSRIVITKDSITPTNLNDTAGRSPKGIVGGIGNPKDTGTIAVQPCTDCDTGTKKPELKTWLPNPPKDPGLDAFFRKNIIYPTSAKEAGIEGTVWLSFIVDTKGNVRDISIAKGVAPALDKEVLRVAKFMPKWDPITDNGEPVEFLYRKPVRFVLQK